LGNGAYEAQQETGSTSRPNFRLVLMAIMAMICFMAEGGLRPQRY